MTKVVDMRERLRRKALEDALQFANETRLMRCVACKAEEFLVTTEGQVICTGCQRVMTDMKVDLEP